MTTDTILSFSGPSQRIEKYSCSANSFNISSLNEFNRAVDASGFAIKYVVEGCERYTVNQQRYTVESGSYLLLSGSNEATVEIESRENVNGICIHISPELVSSAVAAVKRPDTPYPDPHLAQFFCADGFLENRYLALNTQLGSKLTRISRAIHKHDFLASDIQSELFFELAESLVSDQSRVLRQLQLVKALKPSTRRDLYRRLLRGKDYIDLFFAASISINEVAKEAAMSEYHFFRLFKQVFGSAPHQYILSKRLEAALQLLQKGQSVTETALACGFGDIYSFSKSFKKCYGSNPSAFLPK